MPCNGEEELFVEIEHDGFSDEDSTECEDERVTPSEILRIVNKLGIKSKVTITEKDRGRQVILSAGVEDDTQDTSSLDEGIELRSPSLTSPPLIPWDMDIPSVGSSTRFSLSPFLDNEDPVTWNQAMYEPLRASHTPTANTHFRSYEMTRTRNAESCGPSVLTTTHQTAGDFACMAPSQPMAPSVRDTIIPLPLNQRALPSSFRMKTKCPRPSRSVVKPNYLTSPGNMTAQISRFFPLRAASQRTRCQPGRQECDCHFRPVSASPSPQAIRASSTAHLHNFPFSCIDLGHIEKRPGDPHTYHPVAPSLPKTLSCQRFPNFVNQACTVQKKNGKPMLFKPIDN